MTKKFSGCMEPEGSQSCEVQPRTGHEGPDSEQRYTSMLSLTLALDGDGWSMPHPSRFTLGNDLVPIV